MNEVSVVDTNLENIFKFGICGYKNIKKDGLPQKVEWLKKRFSEGLRIKTLYSETDGAQGMIEYIPGKYCWRPVNADGYMFIHCLFVGFKRIYKNRGFATMLIKESLRDAKKENLYGIAVVTRKGSFMVGKEIFLKNGFKVADSTPPDFELLVKKFSEDSPNPEFKKDLEKRLEKYSKGLTIIRADQCPYTIKNVKEIAEAAKNEFGIDPDIINLESSKEAQNSPCPFGIFCIMHNGKLVAEHPISSTRFSNIMNKIKNREKA